MIQYHELVRNVLWNGNMHGEGPGCVSSLFGSQLRVSLTDGYPLVTTNRMDWHAVLEHTLQALRNPGVVDQIDATVRRLRLEPHHRNTSVCLLPDAYLQFYSIGTTRRTLHCLAYLPSVEALVELPRHLAVYALMCHQIAHVTDHSVGDLILDIGDLHFRVQHSDQIYEMLARAPRQLPIVSIDPGVREIGEFSDRSIDLIGYEPYPEFSDPL